jgi:cell division protein ZipA
MSDLRLILLIAGVLFIASIAGYEWWRSRRGGPRPDQPEEAFVADRPPPRHSELPEINVVREPRVAVPDQLPVIELASTSASGTRRALGISISDDVAVDVLEHGASAPPPPPARAEPYIGQDDEVSAVRVFEEQPVRGPQLVVSWPNESERRIVTLRVLPRHEPRFAGRMLRQSFASAGFWHGPLDIFHLPDSQGRVVVSAAALAQPGTFDPSIMDSQRFSGINLFAVLPGPLAERDAFDALVGAARALADRLDGHITDQNGEELTAQRIVKVRQALEAADPVRAAGES